MATDGRNTGTADRTGTLVMKTQTKMNRSPPGGLGTATAFEGDEIEELGERIASLMPVQARELREYISLDSVRIRAENQVKERSE